MTRLPFPVVSLLLRKPGWLYAAVSVLALLLMSLVSSLWTPELNQWEERLASRTWSISSPDATERRVVIVDIDEKSTQALGPWPWPRERVADLLGHLDAQGVNLKVLDILFDGAQPQDALLAQALQKGAPSVVAQLFDLRPDTQVRGGQLAGALTPPNGNCPTRTTPAFGYLGSVPALTSAATTVGHITPMVDTDGGVRRVPALLCHQGQLYPSLAVASLMAATGAQPRLQAAAGLLDAPAVLDVGGLALPVDANGLLRVSYQMPRSGFASVSAVDVMQGRVPADLLKGAWVLVGSTAFGAGDAVPTPQGGAVGGVEVHAQILSAALDARTPYVPNWAPAWPWLSAAAVLIWLLLALRAAGPRAGIVMPIAALAAGAALFGTHAVLLLGMHQWLGWGRPAIFVALAATLLTAAEMLRVRAERERLFQNISSYLPEAAARKIALADPSEQVLAESRWATVMQVDLRNFSAYCETRPAEDAATVLHLFYTTVDRIVTAHQGVVEQMVGDSLTAVWNGSSPCEDHARKAVAAAEVIWRETLAQLPTVASRKTPPLDIGIGIETGNVMVGSFGPARRRVHTVMGDAVSVATRLEKLTAELGYPVLLGPVAQTQSGRSDTQKLGDFLLAGMQAARTVHALPMPIGAEHLRLVAGLEAEASMMG